MDPERMTFLLNRICAGASAPREAIRLRRMVMHLVELAGPAGADYLTTAAGVLDSDTAPGAAIGDLDRSATRVYP